MRRAGLAVMAAASSFFAAPAAWAAQCWCSYALCPGTPLVNSTAKYPAAFCPTAVPADCPLLSAVTSCITGPGIGAGNCAPAGTDQTLGIQPTVPDGKDVFTITCTLANQTSDSQSFALPIDNTPPVVVSVYPIDCNPPNGGDPSAGNCPAYPASSSFTISGILDDGAGVGSQAASILPILSTTPVIPSGPNIYSAPTDSNGRWQLSFASTDPFVTAYSLTQDSSGTFHRYFEVYGVDKLGNFGGQILYIGNPNQFASSSYIAVRHVIIDALPPRVYFSTSLISGSQSEPDRAAVISKLDVLSGIIHDDFRLGSLTLAGIQDTSTGKTASGKFWDPRTSSFTATSPTPIPLTINTGAGVRDSNWSYTGISGRNLDQNHTYRITLVAADYVNNASTTTLTLSYRPNNSIVQDAAAVVLKALHAVTFAPANLEVTWGGFDSRQVCASFVFPLDCHGVQITNDDGALIIDGDFCGNGGCTVVRSNPASCSTAGRLNAHYGKSIIASLPVMILAPSRTLATLPAEFHNLGAGKIAPPADECLTLGFPDSLLAPCRGDRWKLQFAGSSDDSSVSYSNLQFIEDQSQTRPFGGSLPLCPIGSTFVQALPANISADGSLRDRMYYWWVNTPLANKLFRNCGDSSTQNWKFVSKYLQTQNSCTFITNIQKTQRLDGNQNIITTRSDE